MPAHMLTDWCMLCGIDLAKRSSLYYIVSIGFGFVASIVPYKIVYITRCTESVTVNHKYNVNSESQREGNGGGLSPLVELTNSAPDICSSAPHWFSPAGGRDKSTVRTFNTFCVSNTESQKVKSTFTGGIAWQKEKLRAVEIGQDVLLLYHDPH